MTNLELAADPNTTPEILKTLATDDDYYVRYWVARHPNTTPEILKSLATDGDHSVRYWVAQHPNTTPEILKTLATDDDWGVRCRVAESSECNRTCPETVSYDAGKGQLTNWHKTPQIPLWVTYNTFRYINPYYAFPT